MSGDPRGKMDVVNGRFENEDATAEWRKALDFIIPPDTVIGYSEIARARYDVVVAALEKSTGARSQPKNEDAPSLIERLRSQANDATSWDGDVMRQWDKIRAAVEMNKGSDLPRLMFEGLIEGLAELMLDGAARIAELEAALNAVSVPADVRKMKARIAELESNERAYEAALGQRTYSEVAGEIEELKEVMREACDLLAERMAGSPARSPGHNARVRLEAALQRSGAK